MVDLPNERNESNRDGPQCWSTATHEYATVVGLDWAGYVCRHPLDSGPYEDWEIFDLSTIVGNPMVMPIDSTDDHYRLMVAVDSLDRVHVVGNMHGDYPRRYVVCTNTADFTNPASWVDGNQFIDETVYTTATSPNYSYNIFNIFSDGTLIWAFSQSDRDTAPFYYGRDWCIFKLPPAATDWVPLDGTTGEVHICDETDDGLGDPTRSYCTWMNVDENDTIHYHGHWMFNPEGPENRRHPFYMRRLSNGTWETVSGDPITLPITYASHTTYDDCALPIDPSTPWYEPWWDGWPLGAGVTCPQGFYSTVDADGNPHIVYSQALQTRWHVYWDGSQWVIEAPGDLRHLYWLRNELWKGGVKAFDGVNRFRARDALNVGPDILMSGPAQPSFDPHPDPVRLRQGVLAVNIPDGDLPRIYTFGHRVKPYAFDAGLVVPDTIAHDGSVDVTVALNDWFTNNIKNLTEPAHVTFQPDGVYLINDGPLLLEEYSDLTIDGNGATLKRDAILKQSLRYGNPTADESFLMLRDSVNITVRNLTAEGVNSSDPAIYQGGPGWEDAFFSNGWKVKDADNINRSIDAGDQFAQITDPVTGTTYAARWSGAYCIALEFEHGLTVEDCQNVLVEDFNVFGVGGDGAYLRGELNDGVTIRRMYVERNGRQGAAAINGNNYTFEDCEVWSRRGGIDMEPNLGTTFMSNLEIGNCVFATELLALPSGGPGPIDGVYIHDNLILYSSTSMIFVSATDGAQRSNYIIANNRSLARASGTGPAIRLDNVLNADIYGNTFKREDYARGAAVEFQLPSFNIDIHDNDFNHNPIIVGDGSDGEVSTWTDLNNDQNSDAPGGFVDPPENVVATVTGDDSIQITWDEVEGAVGYAVFRWRIDDIIPDFNWVGNTGGTSLNATGLHPELEYRYRVVAKDANLGTAFGNFSAPSAVAIATLPTLTPAASWPLDDASGPTIVDVSSTHDGTLTGAPTLTGDSIQFDGASYVTVPNTSDFHFAGDFTIMARVAYTALPGSLEYLFGMDDGDNDADEAWRIEMDTAGRLSLRFRYDGGSLEGVNNTPNTVLPSFDGTKYHVAWTREDDEWTFYLNGVHTHRWGRGTDPVFPSTQVFRIGANSAGTPGNFCTGELSDIVLIDGHALPETRILARSLGTV